MARKSKSRGKATKKRKRGKARKRRATTTSKVKRRSRKRRRSPPMRLVFSAPRRTRTVVHHDPHAQSFSWNDPRASTGSGAAFDHYHGPKVYMVDGWLYSKSQMLARFAVSGSTHGHTQLHRVLQGEPVLRHFIGPMWGGTWDGKPIMRYDTQETHDALSI